MKKEFVRADLTPDTAIELKKHLSKPETAKNMYAILQVIADCLDDAIKGENSYVTFGVTRDKKALMMTINFGGSKLFAAGQTLWEVADKCAEML